MTWIADPSLDELVHWVRLLTTPGAVIALDGRSGTGKSTLAQALAARLEAVVIDGDDFYHGGTRVRRDSPGDRASACIDWRRQRDVLEDLRAGRVASYIAFDWNAFDGRLETTPRTLRPEALTILEGVYSARPELGELVDLRILLAAPEDVRMKRLLAREGGPGPWDVQWHEAESWYFDHVMPPACFDIVIESACEAASNKPGSDRRACGEVAWA